jgi:serine/threonine-protein kinase ATR
MHQSFNAVLHASQLGDDSAKIENARLLWKDGHQRKAIQVLQGAIDNNTFGLQDASVSTSSPKSADSQQRRLAARAHLLMAKWLDAAGQTNSLALREKYQQATKTFPTWEKGHYYLGLHYKKILESEKTLDPDDQSDSCITGDLARLVIENYIRSLSFGTKYLYQTLPRALTLWLEMGADVNRAPEGKASLTQELFRRRTTQLNKLHEFLEKYISRVPAYTFYTALPQIVARITHPHDRVFEKLAKIVVKVVQAHPRQALWNLFFSMLSQGQPERRQRGREIVSLLKNISRKVEHGEYSLKTLIQKGEQLAQQLTAICKTGNFPNNRTVKGSIVRDLGFNHKCTPCPLVVPVESCLTATLPTSTDKLKNHKAFSDDVVTIDSFLDDILVLGSLAKPRRLTARGSDGKLYMLMVKPKDDLRADQRLLEFNSVINRALKKNAESSRRQLFIRTYAVTPVTEDCGIIEWVGGLTTIRDILLNLYTQRGIHPDYTRLKTMLELPTTDKVVRDFSKVILPMFPPVMHEWFTRQFPDPSTWFAARLRYTRSCAVMSMAGTIIGLGDRHGENVLIEQDNGGVFHVDFNCLFEKGKTFNQPEMVPFRLTHNMVSAMGIYGYEGPFRQCCELTLAMVRQQEETLMTILEAFIYDPTIDLQERKKSGRAGGGDSGSKLQPKVVVEVIKRKVRGYVGEDNIPLGVEGQAQELIRQATDLRNLAAMYIGWCAFL